jgi:hypothetical protein
VASALQAWLAILTPSQFIPSLLFFLFFNFPLSFAGFWLALAVGKRVAAKMVAP